MPRHSTASTHESFLAYRRLRWFWLALLLTGIATALYIWHDPVDSPNGGTWLGYALGSLGAGLILWLMWFGVRKRRYHSRIGSLKGWLSAHVYLGLALIFIATLHSGFQFGWNIHTLAYALMCGVIISGVFGVVVYARYPALVANNRDGRTRAALLAEIDDLDQQALQLATQETATIANAVDDAVQHTVIGGGVMTQLKGRERSTIKLHNKRLPNAGQHQLIEWLAEQLAQQFNHHTDAHSLTENERSSRNIQALIDVISAKRHITERLRIDTRLRAWLKIWLYLHIPLAFGLLAALITHILVVFVYW